MNAMNRFGRVGGIIAIATFLLHGQTASPPAFEVATVKINNGPYLPQAQTHGSPANVRIIGRPLRLLLAEAYNVKTYQIVGPDWMDAQRYDVIAKAPAGTSFERVRQMLQSLLIERLQMTIHHETRDLRGYVLVIGKDGPQLKKAADPNVSPDSMRISSNGHFEVHSLSSLATVLSRPLGRPVIDSTGLSGVYDIAFDLSPRDDVGPRVIPETQVRPEHRALAAPGAPPEEPAPSIQETLKRLGLRLESRKIPADMIVIDKVEKMPIEN
jgi:uncharacterized protein (TIGR03435 family)